MQEPEGHQSKPNCQIKSRLLQQAVRQFIRSVNRSSPRSSIPCERRPREPSKPFASSSAKFSKPSRPRNATAISQTQAIEPEFITLLARPRRSRISHLRDLDFFCRLATRIFLYRCKYIPAHFCSWELRFRHCRRVPEWHEKG